MSLYRKYRPQTFEDVVGQEHVAQTLRNALSHDPPRVAHAYLFCGPRGTGKTTNARLLAKCLNCANGPTATPCNECDFCVQVSNNHPTMDLIEIDAASNTQVDKVRDTIIATVDFTPAQGRYRIYIIDEVHMLSISSFNALLKTLEEPPPHCVFVLATTDAQKLPATVASRCQQFNFRRVGPSDIVSRLQHVARAEGMELSDEAARLIARNADGALRDALTLLEQVAAFAPQQISDSDVRLVLGTVSDELLNDIIDAVADHEPASALNHIARATEEGVSFLQLTRDLTNAFRELLLLTVGFESETSEAGDKMRRREQAQRMGRVRLMACVEALRNADREMRQSVDHRLLLELTLLRAASDALEVAPSNAALPAPQPLWKRPQVAAVPPVVTAPVQPTPAVHANGIAPREALAVQPEEAVEPKLVEAVAEKVVAEAVVPEPLEVEAAPADADAEPTMESVPAEGKNKKRGRRIHDLDEFIELWPAVLMRVRKKIGVTAVAYLHDAHPVELDDNNAVLEFHKEFHYAKACEAKDRLPFEQVLNECLATPRLLKFQLAEAKPKPKPVEEAPPEDSDDDDDEDGDLFQMAQTMFGGEVVARSGS